MVGLGKTFEVAAGAHSQGLLVVEEREPYRIVHRGIGTELGGDLQRAGHTGAALLLTAKSGQDGINGRLHLLASSRTSRVERPLALVGLLDRFDIALDREALPATLRPVEAPHPVRQPAPPAA